MAIDIEEYKELSHQFHQKIGIINWYEDIEAIGLSPLDAFGSFRDIEMLLKFCHDNSKYHIITRLSAYKTVNRFVRGDYIYFLASGDSDPSLEKITPPEIVDHMMRENFLLFDAVKVRRRF